MLPILVKAELYRLARSRVFWLCGLALVGGAALGPLLALFLHHNATVLPAEWLQPFYAGGYYNLGLLRVQDPQQLYNPSGDTLLLSAFGGYLLPGMMAVFCCRFMAARRSRGGVKTAVLSGAPRGQVFWAGWCAMLLCSALWFVLYVLAGRGAAWLLWGRQAALAAPTGQVMALLGVQLLLQLAFCSFCVCLCAMVRRSSVALVVELSALLALPLLLNTLDLLLLNRLDISALWVGNAMTRLAVYAPQAGALGRGVAGALACLLGLPAVALAVVRRQEIQ